MMEHQFRWPFQENKSLWRYLKVFDRMRIIISVLLVFLLFNTNAPILSQDKSAIDSLEIVLQKLDNDTQKINILRELIFEIQLFDIPKTNQLNNQILAISERTGNMKARAIYFNNLGLIDHSKGNYNSAIESYQKALSITERYAINDESYKSFSNIGLIYTSINQDSLGLVYLYKALEIAKKINDLDAVGSCYNNLGAIYNYQLRYNEAYASLSKARTIYETIRLTDKRKKLIEITLTSVYYNLSNTLFNRNKIEQTDIDSALFFIKKSVNNYNQLGLSVKNLTNYLLLAEIYQYEKKIDSSFFYCFKAVAIANEINSKEGLCGAYFIAYSNYSYLDDYKNALKYHELYTQLIDELFSSEKTKTVIELNAKYETEKQQKEIESQKAEIQKRNLLIYSILFIVVVIFLITLFSVLQLRLNHKKKTAELRQKLLRTQMNPHFIFNALTSIQSSILEKETDEASQYLSDFAKLMRLILEYSDRETISLTTEIDILKFYLEIQQKRFNNLFDFTIKTKNITSTDLIKMPPMLAQPFIENAIEHGIIKKCAKGQINISFSLESRYILFSVENYCTAKINDVGEFNDTKFHIPKAIFITEERLKLLNTRFRKKISFKLSESLIHYSSTDKKTVVTFRIPIV